MVILAYKVGKGKKKMANRKCLAGIRVPAPHRHTMMLG
jgi:hypothetical protein